MEKRQNRLFFVFLERAKFGVFGVLQRIVAIFYFVEIYFFSKIDYIQDGRSYWVTALDFFVGFMIIFSVLLLLFKVGNWVYLKNKKGNGNMENK